MVYFFNNTFADSLSLPVNNLGLLRGYSAFEYLRTYDKSPFCLKAHIARFLYSMEKMGLESPYSFEELENITLKLASLEIGDCGIKWYASAGFSSDGLRHQKIPEVFAFTQALTPIQNNLYIHGILTETVLEKRPLPEAKTTAYFSACQKLSSSPHLHEIIYLNGQGELLEAATSNLFLVKDNTIYTASSEVLHGITREVVLWLAEGHYPVIFKKINYQELSLFDEAFVTATNKEILPIRQIDSIKFKIGPVSKNLQERFTALIKTNPNSDYIPPIYKKDVLLKI